MISIKIPNNNISERKYIIEILFHEFLGLEYEIIVEDKITSWIIQLENKKELIFKDSFFNKFSKNLEYLKLENIPLEVKYVKNEFIIEDDIPVIYGNNEKKINEKKIVCGIDIFASSFFMLTRWEEYVNKNVDSHNRFSATESVAFKNSFLDRPIVNEYVEMLWKMLKYLGVEKNRKERKFKMLLTHDVDHIEKWNTLKKIIRHLGGDLIVRKSMKEFFCSLYYYFQVRLKIKNDPYDTFDYLMDISEKNGVKSYFFFMGKGKTKFDNAYKSEEKFILNLTQKIKKRGHYIGMHPTYDSYNNSKQFKNEKKELEKNLKTKIEFGRKHYLRFEVPMTWQIWEDNGMKWDSTLSFADKEGFRCGVCYEYSVFNILTQEKLKLKEKPLIVMEGSFATYQPNINPNEMENKIKELIDKVKKYSGEFVFLWHNSSFHTTQWKKYQDVYERVLK